MEQLKRKTQELGADTGTNPGIAFSDIYILTLREIYYLSLLLKYIIPEK